MSNNHRILILASSFPKYPTLMNLSPWALEQTMQLASMAQCTVVSPTPDLKIPRSLIRILPTKLQRWSQVARQHNFGQFTAFYPRVPIRTYKRKARFFNSDVVATPWGDAIEQCIDVREFNLILAHHPMIEGLIASKFRKRYGTPFVTVEHSHDDPFGGNQRFQANYARVAETADVFVCPSQHVMRSILNKYQVMRPTVVYNGGSQPLAAPKSFDLGDGRINFISVGAISEYKNYGTLIKAFDDPLLRQKARLEIVGSGPLMKETDRLIKSLGLGDVVTLAGPAPHELVIKKLDRSHAFCLISAENFSVAAVEAMGRGLPLAITESAGVPEVMEDGREGFIIKSDCRMDSTHVAAVLKRFIAVPAILPKMSQAAVELSRSLTWKANADEMLRLFAEVIKGAGDSTS